MVHLLRLTVTDDHRSEILTRRHSSKSNNIHEQKSLGSWRLFTFQLAMPDFCKTRRGSGPPLGSTTNRLKLLATRFHPGPWARKSPLVSMQIFSFATLPRKELTDRVAALLQQYDMMARLFILSLVSSEVLLAVSVSFELPM